MISKVNEAILMNIEIRFHAISVSNYETIRWEMKDFRPTTVLFAKALKHIQIACSGSSELLSTDIRHSEENCLFCWVVKYSHISSMSLSDSNFSRHGFRKCHLKLFSLAYCLYIKINETKYRCNTAETKVIMFTDSETGISLFEHIGSIIFLPDPIEATLSSLAYELTGSVSI